MKLVAALAIGVALTGASTLSRAQERSEPVPKALERVGVEEHLGRAIPLQLTFKDEQGKDVALGSFFKPGHPVILTLNYYRCPMLCTLELNGLVKGLKDLAWTPGDEFQIVTVSIDPRETPELAAAKKASYMHDLARPEAAAGWHFLTGSKENIEALAGAVGFSYEYDRATDQYGHAAVVVVAMPDGRVSRYLYGLEFPGATLKMALLEGSAGRIGSPLDRIILYCYHYDSNQGRYALAAMKLMRLAGAVTVLVLGVVIGSLWMRERSRREAAS